MVGCGWSLSSRQRSTSRPTMASSCCLVAACSLDPAHQVSAHLTRRNGIMHLPEVIFSSTVLDSNWKSAEKTGLTSELWLFVFHSIELGLGPAISFYQNGTSVNYKRFRISLGTRRRAQGDECALVQLLNRLSNRADMQLRICPSKSLGLFS